jgi:hypothetical protein
LAAVAVAALAPAPAGASQVQGHLYFASKMLAGPVRTYLADDPRLVDMYMLGAVAPDSLWLAHLATVPEVRALLRARYGVELPDYAARLQSAVADVHRDRPVRVTLSLLAAARTPEERAYALGWVTHFVADAHVHALVNRHGGFYAGEFDADDPRMAAHNRLEALELRHVLTRYHDELILKKLPEAGARTPGEYIVRALAAAYPESSAYRPPDAAAFVRLLGETEDLMIYASRWFYYQATHSPREVARAKYLLKRFRPELGRMTALLTDLPDRELYVSSLAGGPFVREWEAARTEALADGADVLPLCVLYLWRQQHRPPGEDDGYSAELLARIGEKLRRIAPGDDLINPRP